MLFKLSMAGFKSKIKDYFVLLVGLVMSIAIYYMFQTLGLNESFLRESTSIGPIVFVFKAGSFLLAIITFFYILYANSFLFSLRQKEFGMYLMLGAKKNKVTTLMFIETIVLGIVSLIVGIALGIALAQGVGQLIMAQLDFTAIGYSAFYIPSVKATCSFFIKLFILTALINSIKLSRVSILELVHGSSKIDRISVGGIKTVVMAIFAIVLLAIGYASMIHMDKLMHFGIIIALITVTAGTYMLFAAFLPYVIKKLRGNRKRNEKGINAFTFAQLNYRINNLTKILATTAMLVALGAGAISGGMAFKNNIKPAIDKVDIYDVSIHNPTGKEKGILKDITFREKNEYHYKVDDTFIYYVKEELDKNPLLVQDSKGNNHSGKLKHITEEVPVGSVLGKDIEKGPNDKEIPEIWKASLHIIYPIYEYPEHNIKIIDQEMYHSLPGNENTVFIGKSDDYTLYKKEWKQIHELQVNKYNIGPEGMIGKYEYYVLYSGFVNGIVFMGFFLGVAFLAMMASCLMFKVLSSASSDIVRYQMLRKIGVRHELLTKSIYKELFLVFLLPAIVGIVHVLVGMNIFSYFLIDPYFRIWIPITMFLAMYTIYYLITVQLYKEAVLPRKQ